MWSLALCAVSCADEEMSPIFSVAECLAWAAVTCTPSTLICSPSLRLICVALQHAFFASRGGSADAAAELILLNASRADGAAAAGALPAGARLRGLER